jgi:type III secretory pathway component EscU
MGIARRLLRASGLVLGFLGLLIAVLFGTYALTLIERPTCGYECLTVDQLLRSGLVHVVAAGAAIAVLGFGVFRWARPRSGPKH